MEISGQLHVRFTPGKVPHYPLDRMMHGPQSRSGRAGEEKKSLHCPCRESDPGFPARSLVAIETEFSSVTFFYSVSCSQKFSPRSDLKFQTVIANFMCAQVSKLQPRDWRLRYERHGQVHGVRREQSDS